MLKKSKGLNQILQLMYIKKNKQNKQKQIVMLQTRTITSGELNFSLVLFIIKSTLVYICELLYFISLIHFFTFVVS